MNPAHFNWLQAPGVIGVERKHFGSFTERAFWIEMIKIDADAVWVSTRKEARRLIVVLPGAAMADGVRVGPLAAIEADMGEKLSVRAFAETVLYIVGLPPAPSPRIPSDQFDVIESDGPIEFENPADAA
jgi:hypothetical protein